ncbi:MULTISPECIES: lycopene cyclase domain-containing protein [unclassified Arthrobacter]|uniref:lycopene cyclase domain-containing protein n=1 Tax=unclassified Arthrobacter TaxID=235627 RepID=UPI001D14F8D3|nr:MULTISPECIES: lycopene cyclase domain-containing protein [unclassified Arthrobacter]MCC3276001.1 lycopene cyclase domain-containing protein [Arthrobacter sp. zg-Y20]MCC9176414.1 lycopene cyclase domain-containing protein [Arthrobacter sp. zg-Y750]MDK1316158.1 lycopene cyclase domain-containing protein [Arthrobacter sp. zg.Y20]WIB05559.1 lycopene cyclase domain-containing protein [Arthrobacter sp. zg-Y20]
MGVLYLLFLLLSLGCMALLDHRFRLFFFADARRAGIVLVLGVLFFTAWDLAGIGADIFYRGETPFMLGLALAPHLPVEEIFFLAFLCYLTMVVFGLVRLAAGLAAERGANRAAVRMQGRAPGQPGHPGQPGQPGRKPVRKPTERPQP